MAYVTDTSGPSADAWAVALVAAAQQLDLSPSPEETRLHLNASPDRPLRGRLSATAERIGMTGIFVSFRPGQSGLTTPFIAQLKGDEIVLVTALDRKTARVLVTGLDGVLAREVPRAALDQSIVGPVFAVASRAERADSRIDAYITPYRTSWFRRLLFSHMSRFVELAGGAFCANILSIATAIFAMQIWDRVIPAQSLPTLWVLTLGVALALLFELIIKQMRVSIADGFGKQLDQKMSALFFARALDVRNDTRPRSPGTLIAQLRELDQIRELMTSTTLSVLFELPFVVMFVFVIVLIGGPLVYVVLAVMPIVLLLCLIVQWPMARLSREGLRESALRNAMLVESIERIEDIKSLQAEGRFVAIWEQINAVNARISMKNRQLASLLTNVTLTLQQLAYVAVLVTGVYLVLANVMTTGALLACSMLTSRAIAPLAQIAGVLARLQAARVARKSLDALLKLPTDHGGNGSRFHRPLLKPDITFDQIAHRYDKEQRPALTIPHLTIRAGERVAIIGRIGSGKSTLLKLASGLMPPTEGRVIVDGTDIASLQTADIRRDIGSYHQDAGLFVGSVRSNLKLGAPQATDDALLAALAVIGTSARMFTEGHGLDMTVQEGGRGLSSGQRQALLLARTLVRAPRALLLDEPTGAMDENTERAFITNLKSWLGSRTLVVATHRYALLDIVDRVLVVDQGRVVLDGPRADVLHKLSGAGAATDADQRTNKSMPRQPTLVVTGGTHGA